MAITRQQQLQNNKQDCEADSVEMQWRHLKLAVNNDSYFLKIYKKQHFYA